MTMASVTGSDIDSDGSGGFIYHYHSGSTSVTDSSITFSGTHVYTNLRSRNAYGGMFYLDNRYLDLHMETSISVTNC